MSTATVTLEEIRLDTDHGSAMLVLDHTMLEHVAGLGCEPDKAREFLEILVGLGLQEALGHIQGLAEVDASRHLRPEPLF